MSWKFNPFTGKLDYYETSGILVTASDPSSPTEGMIIINTTTDEMKIYYGGSWQVLHTLTPGIDYFLLMETGDFLLLETGDKIILE